jgi:hypothetical protein
MLWVLKRHTERDLIGITLPSFQSTEIGEQPSIWDMTWTLQYWKQKMDVIKSKDGPIALDLYRRSTPSLTPQLLGNLSTALPCGRL